jgi:hypothetical protein
MKTFRAFAEHPFGSWIVNGLAVVAFILVLKLLVSQFMPDTGVPGAIRAGVQAI